MDAVVIIGAIIGILVGLIELKAYLEASTENQKLVRLALSSAIIVVILAFVSYYFYFGPKDKGERFIDALRRYDASSMLSVTCTDSPVYVQLGGMGGTILTFGGLLTAVNITDVNYNPFARQFSLWWTMSSIGIVEPAKSATVQLRASGLTDFCVSAAPGLF